MATETVVGKYKITSDGNLIRQTKRTGGTWSKGERFSEVPRECKKPKKGETKLACAKRVFKKRGFEFGTFVISKRKTGKLTTAQRKKLPSGAFVFPRGTKADPGTRKFPIQNAVHARSALSRASNKKVKLTQAERCKVMRTVCRKYPKVGMCAVPERKKQSKLLKSC